MASQVQKHDTVTLTVRDQNGNTQKFKIKTGIKIGRVIDEYCKRCSVARDQVRFLFDGQRVNFESTPKELEMEDGVKDIATLTRVHLKSTASGEASALDVAAAFVAIGHDPNTKLFADQLVVKPSGYLELAGSKFATELSVPGVFAAGDVADPVYRQAITSAGSGAMAALDAERYLSEHGIGDDSEQFNDDLMAELMADFQNGSADDGAHNAYDDASSENILKYANAKADL